MFDLENEIRKWTDYLRSRGNFLENDMNELESHLRDQIADLKTNRLLEDEAFLIAVKRLGNTDGISREFSKARTDQVWKYLVLEPADSSVRLMRLRQLIFILCAALGAGLMGKIPYLFGLSWQGDSGISYAAFAGIFVFAPICLYLVFSKGSVKTGMILGLPIIVLTLFPLLLYPKLGEWGQPTLLRIIHIPILLWLAMLPAYGGADWKKPHKKMDFLRFSGEAFVYTVLLLCGIFVLSGFTVLIFSALKMDVSPFVMNNLSVICGLAAPVFAVYLVEAKRSIVENLAPVLAKVFSPLFLLAMIVFLMFAIARGGVLLTDREYLIGFDVMLAVVLALVVYTISARGKSDETGFFDYVNFALIIVAGIIDCIVLTGTIARISEFGFTPNKIAALGWNIILLVNLVGLAWKSAGFMSGRTTFDKVETWQTGYLPAFAGWAALVVFVLPWVMRG